jgi:3-isopropylmalate/(R)-2-methylmalate dehydratase small subunit
MTPFTVVSGPAVPLDMDNVDTDAIIRIERLATFGRTELGPFAMESLRAQPGSVLNQPVFRGASILVAGRNFACGSSREGAVWALGGSGIRCVIAESFGDIFYGNSFQNGMLPVRLGHDDIRTLMAQVADGSPVTVDLEQSQVVFPDGSRRGFAIDAMKRASLIDGLDDVSRTLRKLGTIEAWQARDRAARPWIWQPVALAE